ncbi:shikimate dehydrogenase [Lentilactobacillus fungorum]|nr:shikimate dehydrogenase [Lentilactobacillus fungorum]
MINGHTQLFGLLAHPAAHSLSPLIHNTSFKATGINGTYLAFDVTPAGLSTSLAAMRVMNIGGFNLSMPLKTAVIPMLDEISPRAARLQAVNTVVNRDGRLFGDSTDGQGFIDALHANGVEVANQTLTVLGAGGAGRAIVAAAIDADAAQINVFKRQNQTFTQVRQQMTRWSPNVAVVAYEDQAAMARSFDDSQIVVNATNVGMAGNQQLPVSQQLMNRLGPQHVVVDVVYFPLLTPFVQAAKQQGSRAANGIGMLVHQAAGSFLEWTGQKMPIQKVVEAVKTEVSHRQK